MKLVFYLTFLFLLTFSSCRKVDSSTVNQNTIYAFYKFGYGAEVNRTSVSASFIQENIDPGWFEGDTHIILDSLASITFNNFPLEGPNLFGIYSAGSPGFISEGTFAYTDVGGTVYTNTAQIDSIDFIGLDTIYFGQETEIVWQGLPVKANEAITLLLIESGKEEPIQKHFVTHEIDAEKLVLSIPEIHSMQPGVYDCTLKREHTIFKLEEGSLKGGQIDVSYASKNKKIVLAH